jgi:hypothetical protein
MPSKEGKEKKENQRRGQKTGRKNRRQAQPREKKAREQKNRAKEKREIQGGGLRSLCGGTAAARLTQSRRAEARSTATR